MPRRLHVPALTTGTIQLDPAQSRHARDVLRLEVGTEVELFDNDGRIAAGTISQIDSAGVLIRVDRLREVASQVGVEITVAAAVPKGDRADWMVEKLSEIGVDRFVPLAAARSVVLPEGKNKRERWVRLATESAKQCKRAGVMRIEALMTVDQFLNEYPAASPSRGTAGPAVIVDNRPSTVTAEPAVPRGGTPTFVLSTENGAVPLQNALTALEDVVGVNLLVGPEGGWTDDELRWFREGGLTAVKLTTTILRVETAAVVAAGAVGVFFAGYTRGGTPPRDPASV